MSSNVLFEVVVGKYAERHFCKQFKAKYKNARDRTLGSIKIILSRIYKASLINGLNVIYAGENETLYKYDFKIVGSNESARASGNRIIVHENKILKKVTLLLVYNKGNIPKGIKETVWWKSKIVDNYDHSFFN